MPPQPPRGAADDAALVAQCREIMARHARSFDRAARLLPAATRDRTAVLYAFCRLVDDTVDEAPDRAAAVAGVAALKAELETAAGHATAGAERHPRPVVRAFVRTLRDHPLALGAAAELIAGVTSDLGRVRVADDRALLRYCYRVAGTVGLMMSPVLGVRDPRALPFALDLGVAMQLTNICRDVLEDAGRDRVYLPADRLARAGVCQDDLVAGRACRHAVAGVVLDLLALGDRYYASADLGLRYIPVGPRQAILVASRLYRGIGADLKHLRGADALAGRTVVSPARKVGLIAAALARNLAPSTAGLGRHPTHQTALHTHLAGLPGVDAR